MQRRQAPGATDIEKGDEAVCVCVQRLEHGVGLERQRLCGLVALVAAIEDGQQVLRSDVLSVARQLRTHTYGGKGGIWRQGQRGSKKKRSKRGWKQPKQLYQLEKRVEVCAPLRRARHWKGQTDARVYVCVCSARSGRRERDKD